MDNQNMISTTQQQDPKWNKEGLYHFLLEASFLVKKLFTGTKKKKTN